MIGFLIFVALGNLFAWCLVRHSARVADDHDRLTGRVWRA